MSILAEAIGLITGLLALVVSLVALYYAMRTAQMERETVNDLTKIRSAVKGRLQFAEYAVRIYADQDADQVWAVSDTLSTDRTYFQFLTHCRKRGILGRITYFAPLMVKTPTMVGALIRHRLTPEASIRNISTFTLEQLLRRFPFKTVLGGGMILVGNQRLTSGVGSSFGHFEGWPPNPYFDFVKGIYEDIGIQNERDLVAWVAAQCRKRRIDLSTVSAHHLRELLCCEEATRKYFTDSVEQKVVGEGDLDVGLDQLAKELRRSPKPAPLFWELTKACTYNCSYCLSNSSVKGGKVASNQVRDAVACLKRLGIQRVCLTGGNPTELADLEQVLHMLHEHDIDVTLCSNGKVSPDLDVSATAALTEKIAFGAPCDPREAEDNRTCKLETLIETAKRFANAGAHIEVGFVLTRGSAARIAQMFRVALQAGITEFQIQRMARLGRAANLADFVPLADDEKDLLERLKRESTSLATIRVELNDFENSKANYFKLDENLVLSKYVGLNATHLGAISKLGHLSIGRSTSGASHKRVFLLKRRR